MNGECTWYSKYVDGAESKLDTLGISGYLPDGTPLNRAGNAINHPENIGPDPHVPGSPLPRAEFTNSIGYLPDGTPLNRAGNAINHPETIGPDMHTPGSALPASHYYADVGYLCDGTDLLTAGNNSVRAPRTQVVTRVWISTGGRSSPSGSRGRRSSSGTPHGHASDGRGGWSARARDGLDHPGRTPVLKHLQRLDLNHPHTVHLLSCHATTQAATGTITYPRGFLYSIQKNAYVDLEFGNDVPGLKISIQLENGSPSGSCTVIGASKGPCDPRKCSFQAQKHTSGRLPA